MLFVLMHLLSDLSLCSECLYSVFTTSFTSSLNFIGYHCKTNKIKGDSQLQGYESVYCLIILALICKEEKTGLIIDLRSFARTNKQVIFFKTGMCSRS